MRNRIFVLIALIATASLFSCAEKGSVDAADIISCGVFNPETHICDPVCGLFNPQTHICDRRDGNLYKFVRMPGGKFWMAENLKYELPNSKCYNNDLENCNKYGRLYSLMSDRNTLCPEGWIVPDITVDWGVLKNDVGGDEEIIDKRLKANNDDDWLPYNGNAGYGSDFYGFAALPGSAFHIKRTNEYCPEVVEGFKDWDGLGEVAVFMGFSDGSTYMITNAPEVNFCVNSESSFVSVRCIKE